MARKRATIIGIVSILVVLALAWLYRPAPVEFAPPEPACEVCGAEATAMIVDAEGAEHHACEEHRAEIAGRHGFPVNEPSP